MASTPYTTAPGVANVDSLAYRNIFWDPTLQVAVGGQFQIDGTNSRDTFNASDTTLLEAGLLMGRITTTGYYRPSIIGLVNASYTSGGTSITVLAAVATEIARLITNNAGPVNLTFTGPPAAAGTVASITVAASAASGTTLTVASLGANLVIGSIIAPADGSAIPRTIIAEQFGIPLTVQPANTTPNPFFSRLISAGDLNTSMILGYASAAPVMDVSAQTYLKTQLRNVGTFRFSDDR